MTGTAAQTTTAQLRLGTRRSPLALAQARLVADQLAARTGSDVRLVPMSAAGDQNSAPLTAFGGTGVFVTELRLALLRGDVDFLVHSYKDMPTAPDPRLRLAAVPERADPRDALVGGDRLDGLPPGSRVGTGAPRRGAQLLGRGLPVEVVPIRGTVQTRLAKIDSGHVDAVILAMAGLSRLDYAGAAAPIPVEELVPAPAQGALALECRSDDPATTELLATVEDGAARLATTAERAFLATLQAGCTAPVGAHAVLSGGVLRLDAVAAAPDGSAVLRRQVEGDPADAARLGRGLADEFLAAGVAHLLAVPVPVSDPRSHPSGGPR